MAQETLTIVFTKGRKRLLSLARRMLGDYDSAEDALQDAFCRLWPSADHIRTVNDAEQLATTTVHNLCIDQLREEQRHPAEEIAEQPLDDMAFTQAQHDEAVEDQFYVVNRIIQSRLTPLQQRILRRHDAEGCSYQQLAIEEQMTEAAIRQQLSRARRTVRDTYKEMRTDN